MAELPMEAARLLPRVDPTDDEIVGAMREIPGYIDVTARDLREVYRRAYPRAVERSLRGLRAGDLMRMGARPAHPGMTLVEAARLLAGQGLTSLPVVDDAGRVVGLFGEGDLLHRMGAGSALELLLRLIEDPAAIDRGACATPVAQVMRETTALNEDAGFAAMIRALDRHAADCVPVADAAGQLLGVLTRRALAEACEGSGR